MTVDLRYLLIDVEDQHHYNSCVGQSLSTYLEAIWRKFGGDGAKEFSPAFIWNMTRGPDGLTENRGISPTGALQVLKKYGCCLDDDFPYTAANIARYPDKALIKSAKPYRIGKFVPVTDLEIKSYLSKGLPLVASMDFGGNHMVCIFGYTETGYIIVNSWGVKWMDKGTHVMPYAEFNNRFRRAFAITGLRWQWLKTAKKWFKTAFKGGV
jgi:hypothetical protein